MESNYSKIISKVNELIDLRLDKGTQPSELMENISSDGYVEVSAKKVFDGIHCSVVFFDDNIFDKARLKYKYVYIYDKEMYLNEIKLIKNKSESTVWSRKLEERRMLEQLIELYNKSNLNNYHKTQFIKSLPMDLYKILTEKHCNGLIG